MSGGGKARDENEEREVEADVLYLLGVALLQLSEAAAACGVIRRALVLVSGMERRGRSTRAHRRLHSF